MPSARDENLCTPSEPVLWELYIRQATFLPMALHIRPEHFQAMRAHAEAAYPEECCGLLLGKRQREPQLEAGAETGLLVELWQTDNTWDTSLEEAAELERGNLMLLSRNRRYWIDPKEILAAQRYARDRQLDIIGVYHSHPDYPAMPSESDRALAWPEYSYIILSVLQGRTQDLLSWRLDENDEFQSEPVVLVADPELD